MLIPDCKGSTDALDVIFAARPDVLNHNLETVARLHRAARPSAAYARSLALLARSSDAGLLTKSGIILGMGETADEVRGAIADLRNVGVDVLTLGQYLRPVAPAPAGGAVVDARGVRGARRLRGEPRLPPRRGRPARALELPRQARHEHLHLGGVSMYAERLARARARMRELGVDVLLLSTGADLPYLTGYEAMPLERLTMLVVPADADAVLVIPTLEAPRVVEQPEAFELFSWDETDDPIEIVAGLVAGIDPDATSAAIGDHTWARFVLDLQRALPDVAFRRATDVTGPLRVVKDAAEVDALRAAAAVGRRRRARHARRARSPVAPSSTSTASWSSACSTAGTSAPTSPSSPPAPTRPARTTIRPTA